MLLGTFLKNVLQEHSLSKECSSGMFSMKNILRNVPEERSLGTFFIKRIFFWNVFVEERSSGTFFVKRMFLRNDLYEEHS